MELFNFRIQLNDKDNSEMNYKNVIVLNFFIYCKLFCVLIFFKYFSIEVNDIFKYNEFLSDLMDEEFLYILYIYICYIFRKGCGEN